MLATLEWLNKYPGWRRWAERVKQVSGKSNKRGWSAEVTKAKKAVTVAQDHLRALILECKHPKSMIVLEINGVNDDYGCYTSNNIYSIKCKACSCTLKSGYEDGAGNIDD